MVGMEEIEQVGTGTGFAEALFEGFAGFACAVGGWGCRILSILGIAGMLILVLSFKLQIYAVR